MYALMFTLEFYFQFLVVMAICTNCLLLVCLYDEEGKWRIEPGLAAILVVEHVLLLIKFGFSHFVPEVKIFFSFAFFVLHYNKNTCMVSWFSFVNYRSLRG
jgi:hypothetical protein